MSSSEGGSRDIVRDGHGSLLVDLNKDLLLDGRVALQLADQVAVVAVAIVASVIDDLSYNYDDGILFFVREVLGSGWLR